MVSLGLNELTKLGQIYSSMPKYKDPVWLSLKTERKVDV